MGLSMCLDRPGRVVDRVVHELFGVRRVETGEGWGGSEQQKYMSDRILNCPALKVFLGDRIGLLVNVNYIIC